MDKQPFIYTWPVCARVYFYASMRSVFVSYTLVPRFLTCIESQTLRTRVLGNTLTENYSYLVEVTQFHAYTVLV